MSRVLAQHFRDLPEDVQTLCLQLDTSAEANAPTHAPTHASKQASNIFRMPCVQPEVILAAGAVGSALGGRLTALIRLLGTGIWLLAMVLLSTFMLFEVWM